MSILFFSTCSRSDIRQRLCQTMTGCMLLLLYKHCLFGCIDVSISFDDVYPKWDTFCAFKGQSECEIETIKLWKVVVAFISTVPEAEAMDVQKQQCNDSPNSAWKKVNCLIIVRWLL